MTIARMGLKVKVTGQGQANAIGLNSIEGSFFLTECDDWRRGLKNHRRHDVGRLGVGYHSLQWCKRDAGPPCDRLTSLYRKVDKIGVFIETPLGFIFADGRITPGGIPVSYTHLTLPTNREV